MAGGNIESQAAQFGDPAEGLFTLLEKFLCDALTIDVGDLLGDPGDEGPQIVVADRNDQRQMAGQKRGGIGEQFRRGVPVDEVGQDDDQRAPLAVA